MSGSAITYVLHSRCLFFLLAEHVERWKASHVGAWLRFVGVTRGAPALERANLTGKKLMNDEHLIDILTRHTRAITKVEQSMIVSARDAILAPLKPLSGEFGSAALLSPPHTPLSPAADELTPAHMLSQLPFAGAAPLSPVFTPLSPAFTHSEIYVPLDATHGSAPSFWFTSNASISASGSAFDSSAPAPADFHIHARYLPHGNLSRSSLRAHTHAHMHF